MADATPGTATYCEVRDFFAAKLQAATPALLSQFRWERAPGRWSLDDYAARVGAHSALFRKFQLRRQELENPAYFDTDVQERNEDVVLTVAYPALPALYGREDYDEIERVMRADARQLRDLLTAWMVYGDSLYGKLWVGRVTILPPETDGPVWFQRISVRFVYSEAQRLS